VIRPTCFATQAQNQNPGIPRSQRSPLTGLTLRIILVVSTAALCLPRAFCAVHPVPLDPNTETAKCIECHEGKAKGRSVHSAIATGCLSCHEIRTDRDITHIKLIAATPVKLCLKCHLDKNAAAIKGQIHPPAVRDCLDCHDPHTSDNKNQLLKPTSGGKEQNLCLQCHSIGVSTPEKGSRHAALDMGCETCHVTHKTGASPDREFKFHLTKATPSLCLDCHDPADATLVKAHKDQPFAKADCLACHDPHESARPKLLQKFVHLPFGEGQCEVCHQPAKDGKVVLTAASAKELCLTCHADKGKQIESATVQHPGATGDCTDCHSPHAGKTPGFPKPDAVNVCLGCHADLAEAGKKHVLHQPAFGQGCATCHEPHGNNNEHLLRVKGSDLCLECHGPDSVAQKVEKEHVLTIFNGKVKLPEDYYRKNKVVVLPLKYGQGHPVMGHPVQDILDPTNIAKVKVRIDCMTCHQPHSSAAEGLLVKDQVNNTVFCDSCHKDRMNMRNTVTP
jgi:predicted CXXCH cytochrome family protein